MTYFPSYESIISMSQLQMSKWDLFEPYMEFIHRLMNYDAGPSKKEKEIIAAYCSQRSKTRTTITGNLYLKAFTTT